MNQNKIRTHPTYRKRPAFRPGRDAGRSLMFLRDFSDKQQHRAYGREHAADDADDGIQRPDDGQRDGDEVERHGEGHVELDGGHHPPGEGHEMRQLLHLIVHQRDIRGVHGDITAHAAHGDADVRLFECRRIVHAVADHADRHALRLIVPDGVQLILRQECSCTVEKHKAKQRQPALPLFRSQGNAIEKFIAVCYT